MKDLKKRIENMFLVELNKLLYNESVVIINPKGWIVKAEDSLSDENIICLGIRYHYSATWNNATKEIWENRLSNGCFTFKFDMENIIEHHIMTQKQLFDKLNA